MRVNWIRISIATLLVTVCLAVSGCGEHAEPLDFDGPANIILPGLGR